MLVNSKFLKSGLNKMAQYLRWMKNGRKEEESYFKPRSRSLDPKALENSGIKALQMRVRKICSMRYPSV